MNSLKYPNAWDFPNNNSNGLNNENQAVLEYSNLNEIAMGAPIGGICKLTTNQLKKVLINKWCGGPAIWNEDGLKVAIPIWDNSLFNGTFQRIGIVDTKEKDIIISLIIPTVMALVVFRFIFTELAFRIISKNGLKKLSEIIGIVTLKKNEAQHRV